MIGSGRVILEKLFMFESPPWGVNNKLLREACLSADSASVRHSQDRVRVPDPKNALREWNGHTQSPVYVQDIPDEHLRNVNTNPIGDLLRPCSNAITAIYAGLEFMPESHIRKGFNLRHPLTPYTPSHLIRSNRAGFAAVYRTVC